MKYPVVMSAELALPQLDDYDSIIDVRSPTEFALDHIPGAINCPVLSDEERVRVGILHKQVSAFEARRLGALLVARNIALHLEGPLADKPREWKPLVYCWRGGNRSAAAAHIFARIGWPVAQLEGGYQAYRRSVINLIPEQTQHLSFRALCGTTGSGKSRLLQVLDGMGAQVLDLEQLANHRGSVLGGFPSEPQPSQKMFESRIWDRLRKFVPERPILVESESKKIGDLRVPEQLMDKIRLAPCIRLDTNLSDRVALLIQDYPHLVKDPTLLGTQLAHLAPLHGWSKIKHWQSLAQEGQTQVLVQALLVEHYDPAYLRSIERNFAGYAQAQALSLPDISAAAFQAVAQALMSE